MCINNKNMKIKSIIKKALSNNFFINKFKGFRFIFLFHDISDENERHFSSHYSTTVIEFKKYISFLNSVFNIVPLNDLVNDINLDKKKNYAAITFDDGFYSILKNAAPILESYGNNYTIFINSDAINYNQLWISNLVIQKDEDDYFLRILKLCKLTEDVLKYNDPIKQIYSEGIFDENFLNNYKLKNDIKNKVYLDSHDIKNLFKKRVDIQYHSKSHLNLAKASEKIINEQIENETLFNTLDLPKPEHFAIPFGKDCHYNNNLINQLNSVGYKYIYTTNPDCYKLNKNITGSDILIPRITILNQQIKDILFTINKSIILNHIK